MNVMSQNIGILIWLMDCTKRDGGPDKAYGAIVCQLRAYKAEIIYRQARVSQTEKGWKPG